jgi:hypothetical protein
MSTKSLNERPSLVRSTSARGVSTGDRYRSTSRGKKPRSLSRGGSSRTLGGTQQESLKLDMSTKSLGGSPSLVRSTSARGLSRTNSRAQSKKDFGRIGSARKVNSNMRRVVSANAVHSSKSVRNLSKFHQNQSFRTTRRENIDHIDQSMIRNNQRFNRVGQMPEVPPLSSVEMRNSNGSYLQLLPGVLLDSITIEQEYMKEERPSRLDDIIKDMKTKENKNDTCEDEVEKADRNKKKKKTVLEVAGKAASNTKKTVKQVTKFTKNVSKDLVFGTKEVIEGTVEGTTELVTNTADKVSNIFRKENAGVRKAKQITPDFREDKVELQQALFSPTDQRRLSSTGGLMRQVNGVFILDKEEGTSRDKN